MRFFLALTLALFTLIPTPSWAGVIYEWKGVDEKSRDIHLRMDFDASSIESGRLDLVASGEGPFDTGLISLSFSGFGGGAGFSRRGLWFSQSRIDLHVMFNPSGFLSGGFSLNDGYTELVMSSSDGFWGVTNVRSDNQNMKWCGWAAPACDSGRGMMRRTDIPEPGSFPLLAIGFAAAAGICRRVKR